jgi:hypothetical protein
MARGVYRYRQCPACGKVMPAGELGIINYYGAHWHAKGGSMRQCPFCGHKDFTQAFKVVENVSKLPSALL